VKGRIYHTVESEAQKNKNLPPIVTPVGYVKVEGIPQPVKVWGLKNLNRSFNMDEVVIKFVNWTEWGKASDKKIAHLNFSRHLEFVDSKPTAI
jgi:hypothetical protein